MYNVVKNRIGFILMLGLVCATTVIGATPFNDGFEGFSNAQVLNGSNAWVAGDAVMATDSVYKAGSISAYIPVGESLTNTTTAAVGSNVWVEVYAKVQLMGDGASPPEPASGVVAQFYFNDGGYPVVLDGALTNWVAISNTIASTPLVPVSNEWVRVSVFLSYATKKWGLFVNNVMVKDNLGFHTVDNQYNKFVVENETYIDNFWINTVRPDGSTSESLAKLTSDVDGDGMGDSFEMDYWGAVGGAVGSADADDDGLSNAEEYSASESNPRLANNNSPQLIPYRKGFESATLGAAYTNSAGWQGITNSGVMQIVSGDLEGSKGLSLSNGLMNIAFSAPAVGSNVWIQIYSKPVFAQDDSEPTVNDNEVATYYVASGGLLRAWSGDAYSNLVTVPANTWLGFAAHLDYNAAKWDLYVTTNGIFGDRMVRANKTVMDFNTAASGAPFLTNIIIELAAETNMYIDVIAASYANTNIISAHTNVIAYDRLVGALRPAGMPPFDFGSINSTTNTPAGLLGDYLAWDMGLDDELRISYTNGWNIYTLDGSSDWQNDGNGMAADAIYISKATGMQMKKLSGRDGVVFYSYSNLVSQSSNVVVLGTSDLDTKGWNYLVSPFSQVRTFNHPSLGIGFTNTASKGDLIYLKESIELVFTVGPGNTIRKWYFGRNVATNSLAPGEGFWYRNRANSNIVWDIQGQ